MSTGPPFRARAARSSGGSALDGRLTRAGDPGKAAPAGLAGEPVQIVKAGPVELPRKVTIRQGFLVIVNACLAQVQGNVSGVLHTAESESLHQLRVGLRRLRSALGLFAKWIDFPAPLQSELKWLAGELGVARDADVLAGCTLARVAAACPDEASLRVLNEAALTAARIKRQRAAAALRSTRYSRLMRDLTSWMHDLQSQRTPGETMCRSVEERLDRHASKIFSRRHRRLLRRGARLENASPEERHRVRIAAKNLRYAIEFFQSLHAGQRARRWLPSLTALQDAFGLLNDAAIADRLLQELGEREPKYADGASFARGFLSAEALQQTEALVEFWRSFCAADPARTLRGA